MKLRNKKTGVIVDLVQGYIKDSYYGQKIEIKPVAISNKEGYIYDSLAELNSEWEDYEEPEEYWFIDYNGGIIPFSRMKETATDRMMKQIGNYFDSREEAEKAVEKLKAWKRLKDKGFRFEYYDYSDRDLHNHIQIKAITNREVEDSMLCKEDLDLLFSQEDD